MSKDQSTPKEPTKGQADTNKSKDLDIRSWQPTLDRTTTPPKGNNNSTKK